MGEDNIKLGLQELGCGRMDRIGLALDRDRWRSLENAVMKIRFPKNARKYLNSLEPVNFSGCVLFKGEV